ncbi:hypothetical protein HanIR_Chr02g0060501 [Helianthus annuus]|nr:hypothetical protein HanIR_Chr02g0060501 [Helianthus annuus]
MLQPVYETADLHDLRDIFDVHALFDEPLHILIYSLIVPLPYVEDLIWILDHFSLLTKVPEELLA